MASRQSAHSANRAHRLIWAATMEPWPQDSRSEGGKHAAPCLPGGSYRPKAVLEIFRLGLEKEGTQSLKRWVLGTEGHHSSVCCQCAAVNAQPCSDTRIPAHTEFALLAPPLWAAGLRVSPVGLQVFQPGLQVIQQVDLLAALRAVHIQQLTVVGVAHLPWGLSRTGPEEMVLLYAAGRLCPARPAELALPTSSRLLFQLWDRGMEINQSTPSPRLSEKAGENEPS